MKILSFVVAALVLGCLSTGQAQEPSPTPAKVEVTPAAPASVETSGATIPAATTDPKANYPVMAVVYDDLHRIAPGATLKQVTVPHPGIAGQNVTVRFYAPNRTPLIRQYRTKIVYDYGYGRQVEVKYRRGKIKVDYDGPSRRLWGPRRYIGIGFYR